MIIDNVVNDIVPFLTLQVQLAELLRAIQENTLKIQEVTRQTLRFEEEAIKM